MVVEMGDMHLFNGLLMVGSRWHMAVIKFLPQ